MRCKNKGCGREIDADSVYCKWCGTRQVREKKTKDAAPAARQLPSGAWTCRVRVGGRDVSVTRPTKAEAQAEAIVSYLTVPHTEVLTTGAYLEQSR